MQLNLSEWALAHRVNAGEGGVVIFVRSNGIHTDLVMPKVNAEADWRPYANPDDVRDPRWGAANYVAIGYGAREFYLNTPTWGALSIGTAVQGANASTMAPGV